MNSVRGLAVISLTLQHLLTHAASTVPSTIVKSGPPEDLSPGGGPVISLFLYNVRSTAHHRNMDLPTRDAAGNLLAPPTVGLELDYLISITGNRNTLESELLLGAVIAILHARPLITASLVDEALQASGTLVAGLGLTSGDLVEAVEVFPLSLDTEERSKLWSVFLQVPYRLSMEYRARAVLLIDDVKMASPELVRTVHPFVELMPSIGDMVAANGARRA